MMKPSKVCEGCENLKELQEHVRCKWVLALMVQQFCEVDLTVEKADMYGIDHDEDAETVKCYFHEFESAGEKAWSVLGFDKPVISERELMDLTNQLRDRLLELQGN